MRWLELKYKIYTDDNVLVEDMTKDSIIIPIGKNIFIKELEEQLEKCEVGKSYNFLFKKPYGERRDDLLVIIPIQEFLSRNINPIPGYIIEVDGKIGIIRGVSSNRVIVDFNNILAGKDVMYYITVVREVTDLKEKIIGILNFFYKIPKDKIDVNIDDNNKVINIKIKDEKIKLPDGYKDILKRYIDEIKDYEIKNE